MDNGISLADIKAVMNEDGFANGGVFWIIILFVILFGSNGLWGNNGGAAATTAELERGFYQQETNGQLRNITNGICDSAYALNNAIKEAGYANTVVTKDAQYALDSAITNSRFDINDRITNAHYNTDAEIARLSAQVAQCCCDNKALQLENKYELSNAIHSEGEKTRALIQENKIETLQGRINQLELQSALCGVVRYPNQTTYSAMNPFMTCGCNSFGTTF